MARGFPLLLAHLDTAAVSRRGAALDPSRRRAHRHRLETTCWSAIVVDMDDSDRILFIIALLKLLGLLLAWNLK
jgi:hypothetical protein